ncbi:MAG: HlyD family secretion protein [Pirellulales bacterium]|nr:HlyD family secretion protein [Pirellulales bacterium]
MPKLFGWRWPRPAQVDADLPAMSQVVTPRFIHRLARYLGVLLTGVLLLVGIVPWQQTAAGKGRVVAFAPLERRQVIEAQIYGRVSRWDVRENSYVNQHDPIVEILDNDPNLVASLRQLRAASQEKCNQYSAKVGQYTAYLEAMRGQREPTLEAARQSVAAAEQTVLAAEQDLVAAQADARAALLHYNRLMDLVNDGIVSTRDTELATAKQAETEAKVQAAEAKLTSAKNKLEAERQYVLKIDHETLSKIQAAEADLATAQADLAEANKELMAAEIKLNQQQNATVVRAPFAGRVLRLAAMQGGENVKPGDPLFELVPDTEELAVELYVDGFNMPLVAEGRKVRLQFEGWPAVQVPGWPSAAVGTFGGEVALVDAADDGLGNFRVVVRPDPADESWPGRRWLKQGVRANGWVLLGQVPIAYEIWRQLNGFPPVVAMDEPGKEKATGKDGKEKAKPPLPK